MAFSIAARCRASDIARTRSAMPGNFLTRLLYLTRYCSTKRSQNDRISSGRLRVKEELQP